MALIVAEHKRISTFKSTPTSENARQQLVHDIGALREHKHHVLHCQKKTTTAIPTFKGTSAGNARQQLAHDVRTLRKYTSAPNEQIKKIMNLVKTMYPEAFEKLKNKSLVK